jgi:hypothetical protein
MSTDMYSEEFRRSFSALQTAWRRGRDSNSRYGFEPPSLDVFVSCRLQNLSREFHPKIDPKSLLRSLVLIRRPFATCGRTPGDPVAESGHY